MISVNDELIKALQDEKKRIEQEYMISIVLSTIVAILTLAAIIHASVLLVKDNKPENRKFRIAMLIIAIFLGPLYFVIYGITYLVYFKK